MSQQVVIFDNQKVILILVGNISQHSNLVTFILTNQLERLENDWGQILYFALASVRAPTLRNTMKNSGIR
jgi:hypothetical protein